jgi:hypothetical protein
MIILQRNMGTATRRPSQLKDSLALAAARVSSVAVAKVLGSKHFISNARSLQESKK